MHNKFKSEMDLKHKYEVKIGSEGQLNVGNYTYKMIAPRKFLEIVRQKIFERQPRMNNGTLKIVDLKTSDIVLGEAPLIELCKDNETGSEIKFNIASNEEKFGLQVNKAAILDYEKNFAEIKKEDKIINVEFAIEYTHKDKSKKSEKIELNLDLDPSDFDLQSELVLERNSLEFDPQLNEPVKIGTLVLTHTGMKNSCPKFDVVDLEISTIEEDGLINGLVYLDTNGIEELNAVNGKGEVMISGENKSVLFSRTIGAKVELCDILANVPMHTVKIPVMFDMSRIKNPKGDVQNYEIKISGIKRHCLYGETIQSPILLRRSFTVKKNQCLNDIGVEWIDSPENSNMVANNQCFDWGRKILAPNFSQSCKLRLFNTAVTIDRAYEEARVVVENIRQTLIINEDRIRFVNDICPSRYITLKGVNGTSILDKYELFPKEKNESGYYREFSLELKSDDIAEIKQDENGSFSIDVELQVEFDCVVDLTGEKVYDEKSRKQFKTTIKWTMEQQANQGWLSVDFGTSAIVASYGETLDTEQKSLLNIHANKEMMLKRRTDKNIPNYAVDNTEPAPFIPSKICFNAHNEGEFDADRDDSLFHKYPVLLSPTPAVDVIMLPCLKTLVGYETVPNVFTDVELENKSFSYWMDGSEYVLYEKEPNYSPVICKPQNGRGLIYVNTVLGEVYKQLFKHIICIDTGGGKAENTNPVIADKLNKLVLSVPNTFTAKHHNILKKIAKSYFPNLRPEYLHVVSESDAVACAYLYLRDEFYKNSAVSVEQKSRLDKEENVLVYDMGAGTLDITYFTHRRNGDMTEIDFKGKVGVNKAGNYLDYVIGEILADILQEQSEQDATNFRKLLVINRQVRIENNTNKSQCEKLKTFIKNTIKPLLNTPGEKIPALDNYNFGTAIINDILSSEKYKRYIKECTSDVFESLSKLVCVDDNSALSGDNAQPASLDVDVVVFSGRSTYLTGIREAVSNYLAEKNSRNSVLCADFVSRKMTQISDAATVVEDGSRQSLKTVVTFGSLVYALWKNRTNLFKFNRRKVFANYGIIVKGLVGNNYMWLPLITPVSRLIENGNVLYNEQNTIDLQAAQEIIFVQSYSSNTAEDWANQNKDMISEICRYKTDGASQGLAVISMRILKDDRIECSISDIGSVTQEPHDDFENESLRKSLWPVVF